MIVTEHQNQLIDSYAHQMMREARQIQIQALRGAGSLRLRPNSILANGTHRAKRRSHGAMVDVATLGHY